jgi:hypothetical protein
MRTLSRREKVSLDDESSNKYHPFTNGVVFFFFFSRMGLLDTVN